MVGKIVNCFYEGSESGFGDFLRGSIHLYERTKSHGLDFGIDISHHPINQFIKTKHEEDFDKTKIKCLSNQLKKEGFNNYADTYNKKLFDEMSSTKPNETNYIFSYFDYVFKVKSNLFIKKINESPGLSKSCSKFFKENLYFSDEVKIEVKKELDNHGLKRKKFNVLHFRLGDEKSFYKKKERFFTPEFKHCFEICRSKSKKWTNPVVVISDSNELKAFIKDKAREEGLPLYVFHLESCHSQKKPSGCEESDSEAVVSKKGLFYAAFDMMIITFASRGYSYSVYDHGSGFFCWLCKIYKVPFKIQKFKQDK